MAGGLRALTLDVWGTVLWPRDSEAKVQRRTELLLRVLGAAGHWYSREEVGAAWRAALRQAEQQFRQSAEDRGVERRWELFAGHLGIAAGGLPVGELMAAYDQLTLEFLPALMPRVKEAVAELAQRYVLGLVCNTGFIPGSALRMVLARHGLQAVFQSLTFSDEFGRVKPDPSIFRHTLAQLGVPEQHALHVGDLEELDVDGAHAAGMQAARYDFPFDGLAKPPTQAEFVFTDWQQFPELLERLD